MVSDNHPDPPESGLDRYVSDSSTGPLAPTHTPAAGKAAEPQEIEQADELSDVNVQDPPGSLPQYERLLGVSEDAFEQPTTSRKELWSYYLYYNGDSGVGPNNYGPTLYVSKVLLLCLCRVYNPDFLTHVKAFNRNSTPLGGTQGNPKRSATARMFALCLGATERATHPRSFS